MNLENVTLRPFNSEDLDQILDMVTSSKVNRTYMLPDYESRSDAIPLFQRLKNRSADEAHFVRCIDMNGVAIGFLNDVEITDATIELGYVIHPDYHNRGYMTRALKLAIKDLFERGYKAVICGAFEENKASQRVMEKAGMVPVEKTEVIAYRGLDHLCVYYQIRNEESSC